MRLTVDGHDVFVATGGRAHDPALPFVVFLHGAGMDHSCWVLLARWFAHHGWNVLAPDLPGHGRSGGDALGAIEDLADWTAKLLAAAAAGPARLVGHSLGSLIALETAARHPGRVCGLALIATGAAIPVSPDLLAAARANDHAAIDMVSLWGHGHRATLGGSPTPGLWMLGACERQMEAAKPGVLHRDLAACNAYGHGLASAAKIGVPVTLVLGERDLMTPAKAGRALAAALAAARVVTLKGAGHMLMAERPDEVLAALHG